MFHLGQVPDAAIVEVTFQFSEVTDVHWFVCVCTLIEVCLKYALFKRFGKNKSNKHMFFNVNPQILKVPYKFVRSLTNLPYKIVRDLKKSFTNLKTNLLGPLQKTLLDL